MPTKLKVLIGLLLVSALGHVLSGHWIVGGITGALVAGLVVGHEAVRTILLAFGWIGAAWNGLGAVLSVLTFSPIALGAAVVGLVQSLFLLYCLRSPDVQRWMYRRSTGQIAG